MLMRRILRLGLGIAVVACLLAVVGCGRRHERPETPKPPKGSLKQAGQSSPAALEQALVGVSQEGSPVSLSNVAGVAVLNSPTEVRVYFEQKPPNRVGETTGTVTLSGVTTQAVPLTGSPHARFLRAELPAAVQPPVSGVIRLQNSDGKTQDSSVELTKISPGEEDAPIEGLVEGGQPVSVGGYAGGIALVSPSEVHLRFTEKGDNNPVYSVWGGVAIPGAPQAFAIFSPSPDRQYLLAKFPFSLPLPVNIYVNLHYRDKDTAQYIVTLREIQPMPGGMEHK